VLTPAIIGGQLVRRDHDPDHRLTAAIDDPAFDRGVAVERHRDGPGAGGVDDERRRGEAVAAHRAQPIAAGRHGELEPTAAIGARPHRPAWTVEPQLGARDRPSVLHHDAGDRGRDLDRDRDRLGGRGVDARGADDDVVPHDDDQPGLGRHAVHHEAAVGGGDRVGRGDRRRPERALEEDLGAADRLTGGGDHAAEGGRGRQREVLVGGVDRRPDRHVVDDRGDMPGGPRGELESPGGEPVDREPSIGAGQRAALRGPPGVPKRRPQG
jgi:hypothetical protein